MAHLQACPIVPPRAPACASACWGVFSIAFKCVIVWVRRGKVGAEALLCGRVMEAVRPVLCALDRLELVKIALAKGEEVSQRVRARLAGRVGVHCKIVGVRPVLRSADAPLATEVITARAEGVFDEVQNAAEIVAVGIWAAIVGVP